PCCSRRFALRRTRECIGLLDILGSPDQYATGLLKGLPRDEAEALGCQCERLESSALPGEVLAGLLDQLTGPTDIVGADLRLARPLEVGCPLQVPLRAL